MQPTPYLGGVAHSEVVVQILVHECSQRQALGLDVRRDDWPIMARVVPTCWTPSMARLELETPVTGTVWKIVAMVGDRVAAGTAVLIMESMKMEIPVESPVDGILAELLVGEGDSASQDDSVAVVETG